MKTIELLRPLHNKLTRYMGIAGLMLCANTQAMCTSFKVDLLDGLHNFGVGVIRAATTKDSFKAALYFASATINASTTAYSATGEATGTGYSAGGIAVTNATVPTSTGTTAFWTPSASLVYTTVTITAFDTVLIYNDTSAGKNAVSVHTFGSQTIVAGTFTLSMPVNDASNAMVRIG
jgi:hypothetical protein